MKANELRIGNLLEVGINDKLESIYSIVQEVNERIILIKDGNILRNMPLYVLKPIPLTEEWLFKFGFKQSDNDLFELIVVNNEEIQYDIWFRTESGLYANIESFQVVTEEQTNLPFLHIKNVHQLQNLYFALTNEELTIKK